MTRREQTLRTRRRRLTEELASLEGMLQGTLVTKYLRCGKACCRCQNGRGHGPKYYVSDKSAGATRMLYVPKERLAEVRQGLASWKRFRKLGQKISEINRTLFILSKQLPPRRPGKEQA